MAYAELKNYVTLTHRDIRLEKSRNRVVEMEAAATLSAAQALTFDSVSKCGMFKYVQGAQQVDDAVVGAADSEVGDTLRLNFGLPAGKKGHFDIVDGKDVLYVDTVGPNANVVIPKSEMDAATPGDPEDQLGNIIDLILAGTILISDGEVADSYIDGERIT